ncbi:ymc protein [Candidatus Vecturithrix granuli]|uniref:Ymc protein n=1 Tax=Vecturithrix granuli TaxID=1499967 RepID=A0A081BU33_VECG1|nr:ymc protein [Candidatus Vecturithrix granuli]
MRPGLPWQDALEEQIAQIKAVAVFVGPNGHGPWQNLEMKAFLRQFVKRNCPVIPVILPECKETPALPLFLDGMTWVDFRSDDPDPLQQLIWGITGEQDLRIPQQPEAQQTQQKAEKAPKTPVVLLRPEPLAVSEEEARKIFGLDDS